MDGIVADMLGRIRTSAANFGIENVGAVNLGDMPFFVQCRAKRLLPQEGTVFVLILPYYIGDYRERNIAYYAIPNDYHTVAGDILKSISEDLKKVYSENNFLCFVDSSPIPEVTAAAMAGLGLRGKNGQLITEKYGSRCFIAEIVTDYYDKTLESHTILSCENCNRCIESCPTGALTAEGLNKDLCLSHITQKKGELTQEERALVLKGGCVWGCDICTDVCPHNRKNAMSPIEAMYENLVPIVKKENLDDLLITKSYGWRGKAVLTRNIDIIENDGKNIDSKESE